MHKLRAKEFATIYILVKKRPMAWWRLFMMEVVIDNDYDRKNEVLKKYMG